MARAGPGNRSGPLSLCGEAGAREARINLQLHNCLYCQSVYLSRMQTRITIDQVDQSRSVAEWKPLLADRGRRRHMS